MIAREVAWTFTEKGDRFPITERCSYGDFGEYRKNILISEMKMKELKRNIEHYVKEALYEDNHLYGQAC
jgi:hypothetical protein